MLHRRLPVADRVQVEELDHQVRTRGQSPANHESIPDLCVQEQDLPRVPESLRRVRASL